MNRRYFSEWENSGKLAQYIYFKPYFFVCRIQFF